MPGSNCSILGCGTCRNQTEFGIFKLPAPKDDFHKKWRTDLLNVITKDRVIDSDLKRQIQNDKLSICEKHFLPNQLYVYPTRKLLKEGSIPALNLPQKSCSSSSTITKRISSSIEKREIYHAIQLPVEEDIVLKYKNFADITKKVKTLKLNGWGVKFSETCIEFQKVNTDFILPSLEVYVDESLKYTIRVFGWQLPIEHQIYGDYLRSMENVTISHLLAIIEEYVLCTGISLPNPEDWSHINRHVIHKVFHLSKSGDVYQKTAQLEYLRSGSCEMLVKADSSCNNCMKFKIAESKQIKRKKKNLATTANLNAPITMTSPERLLLTIREYRNENRHLQDEILILKKALDNASVPVNEKLHADLQDIFKNCSRNLSPFMKLFWEEQKKFFGQNGSKLA